MIGKDVPDTPRPPLAEGEARFVGDPVALVVADDRYLAEDAVDLVEVDYEPLPPVVDYVAGAGGRRARPRGLRAQRRRSPARRRPRRARRRRSSGAAHVVSEEIYQQAYAAVPMETRGLVVEWSGGELTIWAATQAPHEVRAVASRVLGLDEHRIRVIMRDTGGGVRPEGRAPPGGPLPDARRPEGAGAAEVDRGPAREPDVGGPGPPRARRRAAWPSPTTARSSAPAIDHVQDVGAYPTPWPVGTVRRRRDAVPRPVPGPDGHLGHDLGVLQHARPHRLPRARGRSSRSPARSCSTSPPGGSASIPSSCDAATSSAADDLPYANPIGMPYDHMSPREVFEAALERLDYDGVPPRAGRGPRRRSAPRRRHLQLRRADQHRHGLLRHRGRHDPHRAVRQGERVPGRRLHREQPRDDRGAAHRRRPRRRHRRRAHRSRATPPSRPSASAPAGAAAAR